MSRPGGVEILQQSWTESDSHRFHVVLWLQRDLQDLGAVDDLLKAAGGDRLASDPMNLVKGVGLEDALICCTDKNLQAKGVFASVAM